MTTSTPLSKRRPFYWEKRKRVGNYILEDPLGEGSFGRVRYGRHIPTNEKVAVKIITKKVLVKSEVSRKALRKEGNVLQRLDHPNIIKLYETMETKSCYYLVFEMADGGSFLEFLIRKRCLLEDEARLVIREIVSAVDHIHTSGFVHRDLRLENLLLDSDGHIKITGFGLCMLQNEPQCRSNRCGSPAYAAPEVFCNRTQGTGVDIWSIGVCMFAMLIGHLPFLPRKLARLPELHSAVLGGVTLPGFLSKECADLLSRMLKPLLSERINMEEILHHRWLGKGFGNMVPRQPPFSKLAPTVVDTQLTKYISYVCGYTHSEISAVVHERKCNQISATYHLLEKSIRNGFRIPDISELELSRHDSSDEFMYSTQNKIMQEYIENILTDHSARTDGIPPIHSIPLYKSCIKCLKESRCNLHGPDQRNKTPILPMLDEYHDMEAPDYKGSQESLGSTDDVPGFVKQYLIDSNIKTVDDLISMTTDIERAIKLPEMILAYLCQGFSDDTLKDVALEDLMHQKNQPENQDKNASSETEHHVKTPNQLPCDTETEISTYYPDLERNGAVVGNTINVNNSARKAEATEDIFPKSPSTVLTDQSIHTQSVQDIPNNGESHINELEPAMVNPRLVPQLELIKDIISEDMSEQTHREGCTQKQHMNIQTHRSSNNEERVVLEKYDNFLGLRDPYAEEIWISMYPKTIKLQAPLDVSPRRPVLFNAPLSSPKLLTLRQSYPSNTGYSFYRQTVVPNKASTNSYIDGRLGEKRSNSEVVNNILVPKCTLNAIPENQSSMEMAEITPIMVEVKIKQKNGERFQ